MNTITRDLLILGTLVVTLVILVATLSESKEIIPLFTVEEFKLQDHSKETIVSLKPIKEEKGNGYVIETEKGKTTLPYESLETTHQLFTDGYDKLLHTLTTAYSTDESYITLFYVNKTDDILIPKLVTFNTLDNIKVKIIALPQETYKELNKKYIYKHKKELPSNESFVLANESEKRKIASVLNDI